MKAREADNTKRIGAALLRVALMLMVLNAVAASALADAIAIKREVRIEGDEIRLSDVASLTGEDAEAYGSVVIATFAAGASEMTISVDQVRKALNAKRINWARVSLKGFETCRAMRKTAEKSSVNGPVVSPVAQPVAARSGEHTAPIANPVEEVRPGSPETLRARLMTWLEQVTGAPAADFRIESSTRDETMLDAVAQLGKVSFVTSAAQPIGRVPLTIEQYEGEKLVKTTRVTLSIARRRLVVAAIKAVNRGDTIGPGDVEIRELFIDRPGDEPATRLEAVIGQQATSALREGQVVSAGDVQPSLLVERYQIVRVKVVTDTIVVNLEGRAMEDGSRDQVIKVRNESSRQVFLAKVAGPRLVIVTHAETTNETKQDEKASSASADDINPRARTPIPRK
ncbi:MAG: flagellar basal body P-ring formation chaperone FlgA [Phycisphaeraceae bacterium]